MSRNTWADDGGFHRDDPDAPWNTEQSTRGRRKNTRRWCKGKPGLEHTPAIVRGHHWPPHWPCTRIPGFSWPIGCRHQEVCTTCGKVLRPFLRDEGECPDLGGTP